MDRFQGMVPATELANGATRLIRRGSSGDAWPIAVKDGESPQSRQPKNEHNKSQPEAVCLPLKHGIIHETISLRGIGLRNVVERHDEFVTKCVLEVENVQEIAP